jgi:hypothetical protein
MVCPLASGQAGASGDKVAAAKLENALNPDTQPEAFPQILLKAESGSARDEFIEVHIYGPFNGGTVSALAVAKPKQLADQALLNWMTSILEPFGATIKVYE